MSTARAGMVGAPPKVLVQPAPPKVPLQSIATEPEKDHEQEKYRKMWGNPDYRQVAPGEHAASFFLQLAHPSPKDTVIDYGAGTGRGALMIALLGGCKVHMLDFAENCLDEDVHNALTTQAHALRFTQHDLRQPVGFVAEHGFITDVMEHIAPADVDRVLHHVLRSAEKVFFQISTVPDHFGQTIGEVLHLTVQPYEWWLEKMKEHQATILWSSDGKGVCGFYVTAWQSTLSIVQSGEVNTESEVIKEQTLSNMKRGLVELHPYQQNDIPVMILAGGPSMKQHADEIRTRRNAGEKLITVNGSYNWAVDVLGVRPSAQIMVDSREFNKRFLHPVVPDCRYMLASQCHPASFDAVPPEQTLLWHSAIGEEMLEFFEAHYMNTGVPWYPVLGGSTVMLRAIPLMLMLGYNRFEVFGWDSCLVGDEHHGYPQPENDGQMVLQVLVNGRTFHCHPWMVSQAHEFMDLMRLTAEHMELVVHGDGLIAWLIKTASEMDDVQLELI